MAYITRSDVYRVCGLPSDGTVISDNDIDMHIVAAEAYVEQELNTCFQPDGKAITETVTGNGTDTLFLRHYPIITLTSVTINSVSVTTSNVYKWDHTGKLQLKSDAEETTWLDTYPQLCVIVYTYGAEPDEKIRDYTAVVCAMKVLIAQIGGTFDDITSFQLPELSGSVGEPYTNIREALNQMTKMAPQLRKLVRPYMIAG